MGEEVPETPLTFFKPNTSVIGPGESIIYPAASRRVDFEGELAVVIGRICKEVPVSRVPEVIFGYTSPTTSPHVTSRRPMGSGPEPRGTTRSVRSVVDHDPSAGR